MASAKAAIEKPSKVVIPKKKRFVPDDEIDYNES
jgi:hypothetical protein